MKDGLLSEILDWENFGVFNRWSLARGGCTQRFDHTPMELSIYSFSKISYA